MEFEILSQCFGVISMQSCFRAGRKVDEPGAEMLVYMHIYIYIYISNMNTCMCIMYQVLEICGSHHVSLQGRFVSMVVSIGVVEGVGRLLDPKLDLLKVALPILVQAKFKSKISK